jgi:hypothetical protein
VVINRILQVGRPTACEGEGKNCLCASPSTKPWRRGPMLCLNKYHAMKLYGEGSYSSTHSSPPLFMEVSYQPRVHAALTQRKSPLIPYRRLCGPPKPVWARWRREKTLPLFLPKIDSRSLSPEESDWKFSWFSFDSGAEVWDIILQKCRTSSYQILTHSPLIRYCSWDGSVKQPTY